jgi:hypothetical protein
MTDAKSDLTEKFLTPDPRLMTEASNPSSPSVIRIVRVGMGIKANGKIEIALTAGHDMPVDSTYNDYQTFSKEFRKYLQVRPTLATFRRPHSPSSPTNPAETTPTDMALRCNKLVYLVYELAEGLAWRFSDGSIPFTRDHTTLAETTMFNPRAIDSNGDTHKTGSNLNTKHAVFIFNGEKASNSGKDPFQARLNLHIDLLDDPNDPSAGCTPIIIDPDVRYPGGSGP